MYPYQAGVGGFFANPDRRIGITRVMAAIPRLLVWVIREESDDSCLNCGGT
jgi:hypothetical protein